MSRPTHPSRDRLAALSAGRLTDDEAALLETHVSTCDECASTLDELGSGDDLLSRLRHAIMDDPERTALNLDGSTADINPSDEDVLNAESLAFLEPSTRDGSLGRLGRYEILECLGRGAFGIVLKAFDDSLQRVVAVKVLAPELATTSAARKRFLREATAAAQVRHENVVQIHDVQELPLPHLVMEYIPGQSLQQRLDRTGPLDWQETLRLAHQIARGLAAAHAQGLIHRDIKPGNILLESGPAEQVKITDFGLARAADDASLTQSGYIAGTPAFMAPEQAHSQAVDPRADLFSLGSVLYTMVTGRPPFRAPTTIAVLKRVCEDKPRPIREVQPDVPPWLVAIIEKLHAKRPEDRFQSAEEVAELLAQHLAYLQQPSLVPRPKAVAMPSRGRRRLLPRRGWLVAAAVLLVLLGGLGLSDATGVTHVAEFVATVLRIETPDGTLVVEVEDEHVQVTIEGDGGIKITGAGPQQVHLRPGLYRVVASKDGKPVKRELVTITRGQRRIVTISRESPPVTASSKAPFGVDSSGIARLIDGNVEVMSVAYSADGTRLAAGLKDGAMRIWNAKTGKELNRCETGAIVCSVALSKDGRYVLAGSGNNLVLWDTKSRDSLKTYSAHIGLVHGVALSHDGRRAVSASYDHTVRLWDVESGAELQCFRGHSDIVVAAIFSPDGEYVFSASRVSPEQVDSDSTTPVTEPPIRQWRTKDGQQERAYTGHCALVRRLALSGDGRRLLSVGYDHTFRLWDTKTGDEIEKVNLGEKLSAAALAADGRLAVVGDGRGTVQLWDVKNHKWQRTLQCGTRPIWELALSPATDRVAAACFDGTLRIWDIHARVNDAFPAERGAFVVLGGEGVVERKFGTLAEAVLGASAGDTIEIRGNGPFTASPVALGRAALTIRAGDGFRPLIRPDSAEEPLISTQASLVVEGIDFEMLLEHAAGRLGSVVSIVESQSAPLYLANCRFYYKKFGFCVTAISSPVCVIRNCQFVSRGGTLACHSLDVPVGAQWTMENCVLIDSHAVGVGVHNSEIRDVTLRLASNTIVHAVRPITGVNFYVLPKGPAGVAKPIRFDTSENVFDGNTVFSFDVHPTEGNSIGGEEAEALLPGVLEWRERRNVYTPGTAAVSWYVNFGRQPPHGPSTLKEWLEYWVQPDSDSIEGGIKLDGGNVLARLATDPGKLAPDDFRLRPDSAGYRAGPDGKDLGADVDLVGPGPAYERWKQTPEYQQWLKATGQPVARRAVGSELGAFVVLAGEGVAERKFDTLAEAVAGARDGDTIEIRGNGPFVTDTVRIGRALTIRSGDGFRPVIELSDEGVREGDFLLWGRAPLVVEGLRFRCPPPRETLDRWPVVLRADAPLYVANCRFETWRPRVQIQAEERAPVVVRNCEFLSPDETVCVFPNPPSSLEVDNCLLMGPVYVGYRLSNPRGGVIRLTRNTFRGGAWGVLDLRIHEETWASISEADWSERAVHVESSGNLFDSHSVFQFGVRSPSRTLMPPENAVASLARLAKWQGERNVYGANGAFLNFFPLKPERHAKGLEDWRRLWETAEEGTVEGPIRFQGGDLLTRAKSSLETITPDDFRLAVDSAGYQAGPGGEDLGADVDLVGPGAGYWRWKKTPEYQAWLEETGQMKKRPDAGAAEEAEANEPPEADKGANAEPTQATK